jgi:hypothetical protein
MTVVGGAILEFPVAILRGAMLGLGALRAKCFLRIPAAV